jgi:hypothetical protein
MEHSEAKPKRNTTSAEPFQTFRIDLAPELIIDGSLGKFFYALIVLGIYLQQNPFSSPL